MKKTTLFLFSLFLTIGAMAVDDPAVMDVNTSTVYTIQFNNDSKLVYCNNGEIYYEGTHDAANAENANYQFKFINATTDAQGRQLYYIASVGADGFYAYNENTTNAGGAAGSVGLTDDAATKTEKGVWYVFNDGNFQYIVPAWKDGDSYTRGGCCWNMWSSSNNNLGMWGRGTSDPNYAGDNRLLIVESASVTPRRVSVFAGVGGSVSIEGETGTEVEVAGNVNIIATPDYGYEFVNWKKDEEIISTTASYVYNGEEDAEFVAEFRRLSIDEQYTKLSQPTFTQSNGNITEIAQIEFNDRNITGFSTTLGTTTRLNETIKVKAGETYNLTIGYELRWGDISLDQIDNNGTQTKYGPYLCEWEAGANPLNILKEKNPTMYEKFDLTSLDEFTVDTSGSAPYIWLPYEITIDEDHNFGDLVVVRLVVATENYVQGRCFDILLEVAQQHTLNVSAAGWASLYLDFPAAIPDFGNEDEEAGVYIVTGVKEGNWLNLVKVTDGVLPANTGVIVKATQGTYDFMYSEEGQADVSRNLLKGSVVDEYIEGKAYVLGNKNGIGFYQAELNKNATGNAGNTHFKNNAYKSYLLLSSDIPSVNKSAGFRFAFGGTTAVEEVCRGEVGSPEIYDLTGRKLSEITKPGIYIINGNKVIVR